ncbi:MAG: hypothetical protein VB061_13110 [Christensenella sp.]|nr:hypothetical protein [Christensenella sp.]
MQPMTLRKSRDIDIFYNEHSSNCTNCGKAFHTDMTTHLGYLHDDSLAVLCDKCSSLLKETIVRYRVLEKLFDEPEPDDRLWRYMDLAKFISILGRRELYFPSAETLNDPFEGAKGVIERKQEWDDFYLRFSREAIKTAPGMDPSVLTEEYIENNAQRLVRELNSSGEFNRKCTFISCWYNNNYESEAMWRLYSLNIQNAVAIQTTAKNLYLALDRDPYVDIGKVRYIDYNKRFTHPNGSFWYKRKAFEHEKEVRIITRDHRETCSGVYHAIDLEILIDKVYISPFAPRWFEEVVKDIMGKYGLDKPVVYSEMNGVPFY